uniref:Uncharacterized protein n=1 Tax=Leersia perrieri TaxID=77586 RepID=A0A0D9VMR6_9ORYZ
MDHPRQVVRVSVLVSRAAEAGRQRRQIDLTALNCCMVKGYVVEIDLLKKNKKMKIEKNVKRNGGNRTRVKTLLLNY